MKSRKYWINCYFYESSLIFTIRLYSQNLRFIISPHSKTSFYRLFISVSFILHKLLFLWELIDSHISTLFIIIRYYPQSLRHIISPRSQMFFINCQRLLRYYNHRYYNFQGFFVTFIFKQYSSKQRSISLSQFINCLKWCHAEISQSIAYISNLTKGFFLNIYI